MRLIDADEIRKKAVPHTRGEHGYNANIRKWAVLVGDIDDAPTIDPATLAPRWVSVEERLPPNDKQVLCWYEYFRYGDYNRMYQCYGIGICINGNWCGEVANGTNCRVIAWQPLPEPPKEGEKE